MMQKQSTCGHTDRQRYVFGQWSVSCAPCVLSALDVFKSGQERTPSALERGTRLLSAVPRLLDVVCVNGLDHILHSALLEKLLYICVSNLIYAPPSHNTALASHTLPLIATYLCNVPCSDVCASLSSGAEGWVDAAVAALKCAAPDLAQTTACVLVMQSMVSLPEFRSMCARHKQIWGVLLCLIRGEDHRQHRCSCPSHSRRHRRPYALMRPPSDTAHYPSRTRR